MFDAFLKIDGIDGESTDDTHADWIEIDAFSHGLSQPAAGAPSDRGGRTSGRVDHSQFTIVKGLDKASPNIALHCCNGKHIPEVVVELCRASGDKEKYMEYKLQDVTIASVRPAGNSNGDGAVPKEEVSFAYGRIDWTYVETDHATGKPRGNVQRYWDLQKNQGG